METPIRLCSGKVIVDYNEEDILIDGDHLGEIMRELGLDRKVITLYYTVEDTDD